MVSEESEGQSLTPTILKFVVNFWYLKSFDGIRLDDGLLAIVTELSESPIPEICRFALAAMANVASYVPRLFASYLAEVSPVDRFAPLLVADCPGEIIEPAVRFLLAIARGGNHAFFSELIPHLLTALRHENPNVKFFVSALVAVLIENEEQFEILDENDALSELFRAFQSLETSKTRFLYACFLAFARHSVVEPFDEGFSVKVAEHLREVSFDFMFELFLALLSAPSSLFWHSMFDSGLLTVMLEIAPIMAFAAREYAIRCLFAFLDCADQETGHTVGLDLEGFRIICQMVPSASHGVVKEALAWIQAYLVISPEFVGIAEEEGLGESLVGLGEMRERGGLDKRSDCSEIVEAILALLSAEETPE
jgi:hypothetical protein